MLAKKSVVLGVLVSLVVLPLLAETGESERLAVAAAEPWLELVDTGKYGDSWNQAAVYFQGAITKGKWKQSLRAVRAPLGAQLSRKLKSARYMTSLPGAPDGEYVVIQFETSFANKQSATETVTPMKDPDGKWRVSGLFIR